MTRYRIVFIHTTASSFYIVEKRRLFTWVNDTDKIFTSIDDAAKYVEAYKTVAVVVKEYVINDTGVISGDNCERIVL